jgi:hypothetical protein
VLIPTKELAFKKSVVTLNRGDKVMPNGTIPLSEKICEIMPIQPEIAPEAHHLYSE